MKDLTNSNISRQNILNNSVAIESIRQSVGVEGMFYDNEYLFTKKMVADFYDVEERTIERCVESHLDELKGNGYFLHKGKSLQDIKLQFGHVIGVGSKTTQLATFTFRAFLNIGMLLTESEKAKELRGKILDIVIETITNKAGGNTTYVNRRDPSYIPSLITEQNYRKVFTTAVGKCVSGHSQHKYAQITDLIYKAVFKENAREYRKILKLDTNDNLRATLYAEVLLVIASFENGVGAAIEAKHKEVGRQLSYEEVSSIIDNLSTSPMMIPFINDARSKMASRDLGLRDVLHDNLEEYLRAVAPEEYERFIGSQSIDFDKLLESNKDVLDRLKNIEG